MGLLDVQGTYQITISVHVSFENLLMLNPYNKAYIVQAMPWQSIFTISMCKLGSLWFVYYFNILASTVCIFDACDGLSHVSIGDVIKAKTQATTTGNNHYCICHSHPGRRNTNRKDPICVVPPKVEKAGTVVTVACCCPWCFCVQTLPMYTSLDLHMTNFSLGQRIF
jgi:hypothetical protein